MLDLATLITLEWLLLPAAGALALLALLTGVLRSLLLRRRLARLEARLLAGADRWAAAEHRAAETGTRLAELQEQVEDLRRRQARLATADSRNGVRQAIALTRHGASVRQLVDTCGLSHGEAHLVQSLYGRTGQPAGASADTGRH